MENTGYKEIESQEEDDILRNGFNTFLEENNLNCFDLIEL